jgi:O-acetylserine/cysteine efflux transporter|tara:strand:- start:736 stop:1554 length:819 start_codon:yes stop_codon:yes gene_type:complete
MLLFGSSYPIGKIGVNNISALVFVTLRVFIMAVVLLPFLKIETLRNVNFKYVIFFTIAMGLIVYPMIYLSLEYSVSTTGIIILMQCSIPTGVLMSAFFLKEKVSLTRCLVIGFVIIGVIIVGFDPLILQEPMGMTFAIIGGLGYSLASLFSKYLQKENPLNINAWMAIITFPFMLIVTLILEPTAINQIITINQTTVITAVYSGLVLSCIAQIGMFWLYRHYEVQKVLPLYSLFPIFGILLTVFILKEHLTNYIIIGSVIVISGNYILQKIK